MFFVIGIKIASNAYNGNQYAYVKCRVILPDLRNVIPVNVVSRFTHRSDEVNTHAGSPCVIKH